VQQTWWHRLANSRPPDFIIGGDEKPYLKRWFMIPRNPIVGIYLHQFLRSDDDRALHDHPYMFNCSILLQGEYLEHTIESGGIQFCIHRKAGDWKFRFGPAPHRIELIGGQCWTLFITGPRYRNWGFHCVDKGFVPWQTFTKADNPGEVGIGCGEQIVPMPVLKELETHKHFDERMQLGIADMPRYRGELKPLAMPDSKGQ
jgi:hypothetical protein